MKISKITILIVSLTIYNFSYSQKGKQLTKKASEYNIKKDYKNAILYSSKAINKNPKNILAYLNRSYAYYYLNETTKSHNDLIQVLQIDSLNGDANFSLGIICMDSSNYAKGIDYFKKCITQNHNKTYSYHNIGHGYNMLKDYEKAITNFSKAIDLKTTYYDTYKTRGLIYFNKMKNYNLAVKDFNSYLVFKPNDDKILRLKGLANRYIGNYKSAFEDFTKSMEISSNDNYALAMRGRTRELVGDTLGATLDLIKIIKSDATSASELSLRGWVKAKLKIYDEALIDFRKGFNIDSTNSSICNGIGYTLARKNNFNESKEWLLKAISLDSNSTNNPFPHVTLAVVYNQMKEYDLSDQEFKKALSIDSTESTIFFWKAFVLEQQNKNPKEICYNLNIAKKNHKYTRAFVGYRKENLDSMLGKYCK